MSTVLLLLFTLFQFDDYTVCLNGSITKDKNCSLLLLDKKGIVSKKYSVKSFLICIKNNNDTIDRPDCYINSNNVINNDFNSVLNNLPHGHYRIVFRDIIGGPISESNTDLKHLRLKDFEIKIKI